MSANVCVCVSSIMYGLALIAVGYYSEQEPARGFPSLTRAGLVEELVLLDVPDSPGALHYVIHSYDQVSMCVCVYVYMCICVYVCVYICVCMLVCVC